MAISFVGSYAGTHASLTAQTIAFSNLRNAANAQPTLLENDLVIICHNTTSSGNLANGVLTPTNPSGYTGVFSPNLFGNDTHDTNFQISYKFMGASPDTSVDIREASATDRGVAYSIHVLRGVDTTTPFDVTSASASGNNTGVPNAPAITPVTAGAWILISGASAMAAGTAPSATPPTGLSTTTNHFRTAILTTTATTDAAIATGLKTDWTAGAYDAAAFGGFNTTNTGSWCAGSIALRPGANITNMTVSATSTPSYPFAKGLVYAVSKSVSVNSTFDTVKQGVKALLANCTPTALISRIAATSKAVSATCTPTVTKALATTKSAILAACTPAYSRITSAAKAATSIALPASSNHVPNSTMQGAVVGVLGSGGSLPTGWNINTATGITNEVMSFGVAGDGRHYIEIKVTGTSATGFISNLQMMTAANGARAAGGETWTVSAGVESIAGSASTGFVTTYHPLQLITFFSGGGSATSSATSGDMGTLDGHRASYTTTIAGTSAALTVGCSVSMVYDAGIAVNWTYRVYAPQLEKGASMTTYVPTYGSPAGSPYSFYRQGLKALTSLISGVGTESGSFSSGGTSTPKTVSATSTPSYSYLKTPARIAAIASTPAYSVLKSTGRAIARTASAVASYFSQSSMGWVFANSNTTAVQVRVGFPTPPADPSGTQTITVQARKRGPTGSPTFVLDIMETGSSTPLATSSAFTVTNTSASLHTYMFPASLLTDPTGASLEVRVTGTPATESTVEFGYIGWDVAYGDAGGTGMSVVPTLSKSQSQTQTPIAATIAETSTSTIFKSLLRSLSIASTPLSALTKGTVLTKSVSSVGATVGGTATYNSEGGTPRAATLTGSITATDLNNVGTTAYNPGNGVLGYPTLVQTMQTASTTSSDAYTNNRYIEFSVTGTDLTITRIQYQAARGGSSTPRGFGWRTSADGYASEIFADDVTSVRPTLSDYDHAVSIPLNGTVTIRYYPYAPNTSSTIEMDNIVVTASSSSNTASIIKSVSKPLTQFNTPALSLARPLAKVNAVAASTVQSLRRLLGKTIAPAITLAGSIARSTPKSVVSLSTLSATISKANSRVLGIASTASASFSKVGSFFRTILASSTPTTSVVRALGKIRSATTTPTFSRRNAVSKRVASTVTPSYTLAKLGSFFRTLTATTTPAYSRVRSIGKALVSTTTPAFTTMRSALKTILSSVAPTFSLSRLSSMARVISASSTPVGSMLRSFGKSALAVMTNAATIVRSPNKVVTGTTTPSYSIRRAIARVIGPTVTPAVALIRSSARSLSVTMSNTATRVLSTSKAFISTTAPTYAVSAVKSFTRAITAVTTPATSMLKPLGRRVDSAIAATAAVIRAIPKTFSSDQTPAATASSAAAGLFRVLDAATTPVMTTSKAAGKLVAAGVSATSSSARAIARAVTATVTPTAILSRLSSAFRTISATAPGQSSVVRSFNRISSVVANSASSLTKSFVHVASSAVSAFATTARVLASGRIFGATTTPLVQSSKSSARTITVSETSSASMIAIKAITQIFTATATTVISRSRALTKTITGSSSPLSVVIKSSARVAQVIANAASTLSKTAGRVIAALVDGTSSITRSAPVTASASANGEGSVVATNAISRVVSAVSNMASTVARSLSHTFGASALGQSYLGKTSLRVITVVSTSVSSVARSSSKTFARAIDLAASISAIKGVFFVFGAAANAVAAVTKSLAKTASGSATALAQVTKASPRTIAVTASGIAQTMRAVARSVVSFVVALPEQVIDSFRSQTITAQSDGVTSIQKSQIRSVTTNITAVTGISRGVIKSISTNVAVAVAQLRNFAVRASATASGIATATRRLGKSMYVLLGVQALVGTVFTPRQPRPDNFARGGGGMGFESGSVVRRRNLEKEKEEEREELEEAEDLRPSVQITLSFGEEVSTHSYYVDDEVAATSVRVALREFVRDIRAAVRGFFIKEDKVEVKPKVRIIRDEPKDK